FTFTWLLLSILRLIIFDWTLGSQSQGQTGLQDCTLSKGQNDNFVRHIFLIEKYVLEYQNLL
uniref:hypothetical protein n=1 Tax=Vibrio sp. Vb0592 TaxID=2816072 RepID=UPI001A90C1BA